MKIISGGQTGVDRLALEVGKSLSIDTGGTAPKGYLTENGNDITLKSFGLVEHRSVKYPPRTKCNVLDSDGTVYFATDTTSRGLQLTKRLCDESGRPFILNPSINEFQRWISDNNISTINIAGNRGSKLSETMWEQIRVILIDTLSPLL